MHWQQPQKQEIHPTEFYGFWLQAVSSQMAKSEVTDRGKEPAWCQRTTWSLKKKKKRSTRSQVSRAPRPEVKLEIASIVDFRAVRGLRREQMSMGPKCVSSSSTFHEVHFCFKLSSSTNLFNMYFYIYICFYCFQREERRGRV